MLDSYIFDFDIYEFIGFIGMILIVYAYLLSYNGKSNTYKYIFINLIGAILLIISLIYHFNLGSFMIEIFWIFITMYSLIKRVFSKKDRF